MRHKIVESLRLLLNGDYEGMDRPTRQGLMHLATEIDQVNEHQDAENARLEKRLKSITQLLTVIAGTLMTGLVTYITTVIS